MYAQRIIIVLAMICMVQFLRLRAEKINTFNLI